MRPTSSTRPTRPSKRPRRKRCSTTTSSSPGRSRRRLGWLACAWATPLPVRRPSRNFEPRGVSGNINVMTAAGALASLDDPDHMVAERDENRRVREFTINAFKDMGYEASDSQTNFLFVNIRRPAAEFRDAAPRPGRHGGARLPADGADPLAYLARHDGRDAARRRDLQADSGDLEARLSGPGGRAVTYSVHPGATDPVGCARVRGAWISECGSLAHRRAPFGPLLSGGTIRVRILVRVR